MLWAISGGAGFLGLHLSRRLADSHKVRTLDLAPLDEPSSRAGSTSSAATSAIRPGASSSPGASILHAAAALPISGARTRSAPSTSRAPQTLLAAALEARVRRVVFISTTAVYGVPETHPIDESALHGVGHYGRSKIEAEEVLREFERRGLAAVVIRPKTFIGPERLGVFEILFDWIREGRRIYVLGSGRNRYQLLAVEDLVDAIALAASKRTRRGDVERRRHGVRHRPFGPRGADSPCGLDEPCHSGSGQAAELALRALELARLSPLAEWHYKTAHRDSYVDVSRAEQVLGWRPRRSNADALIRTYDWYLANRDHIGAAGLTHRVPWDQRALGLIKRIS